LYAFPSLPMGVEGLDSAAFGLRHVGRARAGREESRHARVRKALSLGMGVFSAGGAAACSLRGVVWLPF